MKNGENFNSAADASKSFEDAYGSWDTLREEFLGSKVTTHNLKMPGKSH